MASLNTEAEKLLEKKLADVELTPGTVQDLEFLRKTFLISPTIMTASLRDAG